MPSKKPKKPRISYGETPLREWRENTPDLAAGKDWMTLARVCELLKEKGVNFSHASLGRMERQKQGYKQSVLEGLKKIYGVDPAIMISVRPNQSDRTAQLLRIWSALPPEAREKALTALRLFVPDHEPDHDEPPHASTRF